MALIKVNNRGQSADVSTESYGRRNLIINGAMQVSQRTVGETSVNSDRYSACDRFYIANNMVHYTVSQETLTSSDAPFNEGFGKALKLDVTTAQASPAATDRTNIQYRFEGQDLQGALYGTSNAKVMTLSFWVKATKTGTNVITFYQDDAGKQTSVSYTISASDTWEYKQIQCPANVTDAITNDKTRGFIIHWWLGAGSNRQSGSLQSTWTAYSTGDECPGQVNHGDSTSNNFHLTGVQFEYGDIKTPFEHRSYQDYFMDCARYCFVYGTQDDQTGVYGTNSNAFIEYGYAQATTAGVQNLKGPVPFRVVPSLAVSGTGHVAQHLPGQVRSTCTSITTQSNLSSTVGLAVLTNISSNANFVQGKIYMFEFQESQRGWLKLDAEI